jgi:hypothetical protein
VLALSPKKEYIHEIHSNYEDDNFINVENPTGFIHLF